MQCKCNLLLDIYLVLFNNRCKRIILDKKRSTDSLLYNYQRYNNKLIKLTENHSIIKTWNFIKTDT